MKARGRRSPRRRQRIPRTQEEGKRLPPTKETPEAPARKARIRIRHATAVAVAKL